MADQETPNRVSQYPPDTEERIAAVQEALHGADSMLVIEEALNRATMPGERWPQGSYGDYPNAAFSLAIARLLVRSPIQARACMGYAGWDASPRG